MKPYIYPAALLRILLTSKLTKNPFPTCIFYKYFSIIISIINRWTGNEIRSRNYLISKYLSSGRCEWRKLVMYITKISLRNMMFSMWFSHSENGYVIGRVYMGKYVLVVLLWFWCSDWRKIYIAFNKWILNAKLTNIKFDFTTEILPNIQWFLVPLLTICLIEAHLTLLLVLWYDES